MVNYAAQGESILPELRGEVWLCLQASEEEARGKNLREVARQLETNRCVVFGLVMGVGVRGDKDGRMVRGLV